MASTHFSDITEKKARTDRNKQQQQQQKLFLKIIKIQIQLHWKSIKTICLKKDEVSTLY